MTAAQTAAGLFGRARRLVVKIGSSLLVHPESGTLRHDWLEALAGDIAGCRARGQEVTLVSSGAIALGRRQLGLPAGPLRLEESQAAAAVGQVRLVHAYQAILAPHELRAAQVLLTLGDTEARRRYLNARNTLATLLRLGVVPVINENDTVATTEIRYGDNDRLAARVAQMITADCLVLLSDIDGLYTADPRRSDDATHVAVVERITPAVEAMASARAGTEFGSGGMTTKLIAATIAVGAGCHTVIANGTPPSPLAAILAGGRCTWFVAQASPRAARKEWIAGSLVPAGAVMVDAGAVRALGTGKSLLPAGVVGVEGGFQRGDAVLIKGPDGAALGRGLSAYSAADAL
ncbi:MAG: glutamate 5-kinase, partial [Alphaproteobacteria bacterium]|nr:glutamate 5-kinase [Alphaproteobacteria bacterium]